MSPPNKSYVLHMEDGTIQEVWASCSVDAMRIAEHEAGCRPLRFGHGTIIHRKGNSLMAYSRWLHSEWYTFWMVQDKDTENRDTAIFEICTVCGFTAKELRDDMKGCLARVKEEHPDGDYEELQLYMRRFLRDVDEEYPSEDSTCENPVERKILNDITLLPDGSLLLPDGRTLGRLDSKFSYEDFISDG